MSDRPPQDDRLWQLIEGACSGTLSPSQQKDFADRLDADPIARQLYLDYCELHSGMRFMVHSDLNARQALERIDEMLAEQAQQASVKRLRPLASAWSKRALPQRAMRRAAPLLAACLVGVLATLWWTSLREGLNSAELSAGGEDPSATPLRRTVVAATLTGMVDCTWWSGMETPTFGEHLEPGRLLRLNSGFAQLTFEDGAKVVLQGPASLVVRSSNEATMGIGKLTALVPVRARGFTVDTPTAEVVDLGTEFGLQVGRSGQTEVHVFKGEVVSRALGINGEKADHLVQLTEQQGVVFDREGLEPLSIAAQPDKFVREISPRLASADLPALPETKDLALWLAADVLVSTDAEKGVLSWQDILVGDNQFAEDALQQESWRRPQFVEEGIGGRPTIRFDGKSDFLVTTPLASTDDQTLFIVFQRGAEPENPFPDPDEPMSAARQLINYDGPPHTLIPNRKRIMMIGDRLEPGVYWGRVYAQHLGPRFPVRMGSVECQRKVEVGEPAIITYSYHPSSNSARMYLDGQLQGEATAPGGQAIVSRKMLGRVPLVEAYFEGDMSEVIIYNGALDQKQIDAVVQYLAEKYSIDTQLDGETL